MSHNWKYIALRSTLGLLLTAVLVGAYILGSRRQGQIRCSKVEIVIQDSLKTPFVTSSSIRQYLASDYGDVIGHPIDSIDLFKIEDILNTKGAILKSEACVNSNGKLEIIITQRKPALRFQTQSYGFYCDTDGVLLPLQPNFRTDVLIIDGHIPLDPKDCENGRPDTPEKCMWLDKMATLANYINGSSIWKDRIAQVHCQQNGEIIIVPKVGNEKFIFGHPDKIAEKFEKMQIYYERILADKGEGTYCEVDLRYRKQIVCKNTDKKKK